MTALPPLLAPWAPALARFAPAFAGVIGPWLGPLRLALGAPSARTRPGDGPPDGYDGLARRGSPERLLPGDWLLAEEVPDEFLRRASQGELNYLRLARTEPASSRRCAVLFDVGPELLGAPRLALVALLLVFERRCADAGVALQFGALQRLEDTPPGARGALKRALLTPAATPGQPAMLEAWRARLEPADELWVVGAGALMGRLGAGADGLIAVEDTLEVDPGALSVTIRQIGGRGRSLKLPLPAPEACAQALREPFVQPRARRQGPERTPRGIWMSPSGHRLALLGPLGGVRSCKLPSAPGGAVRWRELPRSGRRLIGLGWWKRSLIRLETDGERIHRLGGPDQRRGERHVVDWEAPLVLPPGDPPRPLLMHREPRTDRFVIWMVDGARQLITLRIPAADRPAIALEAREVYGIAWTRRGPSFVSRQDPERGGAEPGGLTLWSPLGGAQRIAGTDGPATPRIHFGCAGSSGAGSGALVALEREPGRWGVHHAGHLVSLNCEEGRVIGVAMDGCWPDPGPALVILRDGELSLQGLRGKLVLARNVAAAPAPALSTLEPWMTWVNDEGALVVYRLDESRIWTELPL